MDTVVGKNHWQEALEIELARTERLAEELLTMEAKRDYWRDRSHKWKEISRRLREERNDSRRDLKRIGHRLFKAREKNRLMSRGLEMALGLRYSSRRKFIQSK
jgi:hypothetical protein